MEAECVGVYADWAVADPASAVKFVQENWKVADRSFCLSRMWSEIRDRVFVELDLSAMMREDVTEIRDISVIEKGPDFVLPLIVAFVSRTVYHQPTHRVMLLLREEVADKRLSLHLRLHFLVPSTPLRHS